MEAKCSCGSLRVEMPGPTDAVVACHCRDCQHRSGSPFGVGAYYETSSLKFYGEPRKYERDTATGGTFTTWFCPTCGTSLYWQAGKHPTMTGVAIGCIESTHFPPPIRSVWEQSKHHWVEIGTALERFEKGRP